MTGYIGDYTPAKTVRLRFNSHKADGTPITLAGSPVISVYKGNTTESTAGVTLTVNYDSRTGLHDVVIDTSADGTFYAAGNDFDVVITTGTVDSISVIGTVVGSFSLSNRSALRPTTADRTLTVDAVNAVTVGALAAGSITDAAFTVPSVTSGVQTGILAMIQAIYRRFFKKVVKDSAGGTIKTYANDNTTVLTTQTITTVGSTDTVGPAA